MLQRAATGLSPASMPPSLTQRCIHRDSRLTVPRGFMEPRFGRDFSGVRVHTDPSAAESARAVMLARDSRPGHCLRRRPVSPPHCRRPRLAAHELAHTVQQSGLQRFPSDVQMGGPLEPQLEREAETAARAVMGTPHDVRSSAVPVPSRLGVHTISRAPARCPEAVPDKPIAALKWDDPPAALAGIGVKKVAKAGPNPKIRRFNMGAFPLPSTKGPVKNCWLNRAKAGALEAKYSVSGDSKLALSQGGEDTLKLRKLWEQKLGWMPDTAPAKWAEIKAKSFDPPTAADGKTCNMDHIIELQAEVTTFRRISSFWKPQRTLRQAVLFGLTFLRKRKR